MSDDDLLAIFVIAIFGMIFGPAGLCIAIFYSDPIYAVVSLHLCTLCIYIVAIVWKRRDK